MKTTRKRKTDEKQVTFQDLVRCLSGRGRNRNSGLVRGYFLETGVDADGEWWARVTGCGASSKVCGFKSERAALRELRKHGHDLGLK